MSSQLVVDGLTVAFDSGGYVVKPLDGLSFTAEDGELVVLLGPSGCGKTTLLSCLAGLLSPTEGHIAFGDTEVTDLRGPALSAYRRHTVGVVFQAFNLIASLTARGNVVVPMRLAGVPRGQARARAVELLDTVGLSERAHHRPAQLSGGQQQRVAIARALVHDPPLILADEPTAHLDHIQVEGILRLLRDLASPGRIIVVSTHDDRVSLLADRVVELVPRFADADRPRRGGAARGGRHPVPPGRAGRPHLPGRVRPDRGVPGAGQRRHRGAAPNGCGTLRRRTRAHPQPAQERVGPRPGGGRPHRLHGARLPQGSSPPRSRAGDSLEAWSSRAAPPYHPFLQ